MADFGAREHRVGVALAVGLLVFSVLVSALFMLPPAAAPQISMTVLGDSVREVNHGETVEYEIGIKNTGDDQSRLIALEVLDIPDNWNARIDPLYVKIPGGSSERVTLIVTAPSVESAVEMGAFLDNVAAIGVRGANTTVGTITILDGTVELTRAGSTQTLSDTDNGFEIESGDILSSTGNARLDVDLSLIWSGYTGMTYLGLHDATIGFLLSDVDDIAYFWIEEGSVDIYTAGGSATTVRADGEWLLEIGASDDLNGVPFAPVDYGAVVSFAPTAAAALFTADVSATGEVTAAVYEGDLSVVTKLTGGSSDGKVLSAYEMVTGMPDSILTAAVPVEAIVLTIPATGATEQTISVDGTAIQNVPGVYILKDVDNQDIYIIPAVDAKDTVVKVMHTGAIPGNFETTFAYIDQKDMRSITIDSSATTGTGDTFTFTRESVSIDTTEDKTYDVVLSYSENGATATTFELDDVDSNPDKIQDIEVVDWLDLDKKGSVRFTEGKTTVTVRDGDDGASISKKIKDEQDTGDDDETSIYLFLGLAVFFLALVIVMFLFFSPEQESELMPPEQDDWKEDEEKSSLPDIADDEKDPSDGSSLDSMGEDLSEVPQDSPVPPSVPFVPPSVEEGSIDGIFPVNVECHNCGKDYVIKSPSAYQCTDCGTPFKINKKGHYLKPVGRKPADESVPDSMETESVPPSDAVDPDEPAAKTLAQQERDRAEETISRRAHDPDNIRIPKCPNCGFDYNMMPPGFDRKPKIANREVRCARCYINYPVNVDQ